MRLKNKTKKMSLIILCFLWLAIIAVGGTIAYIFTSTQQVVNTFSVPSDGSNIVEVLEGNVKKEVVIENTGNVDSYIRAKVIFTWQNEAGVVHPTKVKVGDYKITWGTDWVKIPDTETGFYYYKGIVKANDGDASTTDDQTKALFTDCEPLANAPEEGYTLHVEILSQSIQSTPAEAVQEAWGMTYTEADGTGTWSAYATDGSN